MKKFVNELEEYAEAAMWGTYYIIKILLSIVLMIAMGKFAFRIAITALLEK